MLTKEQWKEVAKLFTEKLNSFLKIDSRGLSNVLLDISYCGPYLYNQSEIIGNQCENYMSALGLINSLLPKNNSGYGLIIAHVEDDNHNMVVKFEVSEEC